MGPLDRFGGLHKEYQSHGRTANRNLHVQAKPPAGAARVTKFMKPTVCARVPSPDGDEESSTALAASHKTQPRLVRCWPRPAPQHEARRDLGSGPEAAGFAVGCTSWLSPCATWVLGQKREDIPAEVLTRGVRILGYGGDRWVAVLARV